MEKLSEMEIIGGPGCGGGTCPTLYKNKNGRFFIQGYIVDKKEINTEQIPNNESIVEITEDLLKQIQNAKK